LRLPDRESRVRLLLEDFLTDAFLYFLDATAFLDLEALDFGFAKPDIPINVIMIMIANIRTNRRPLRNIL